MLTLNLEESLVKQNRRLITPEKLLLVKEYEKNETIVNNDALARTGLNVTIIDGKTIKSIMNKKKNATLRFNQEKVFHITQIKEICDKYHLKFLPTRYYKGTIDNKLPEKISTFETAYDVRCDKENSYIMAPASSFKLEERPKDPLLFYAINNEYFYLIHKWGDDMNITRRLVGIASKPWSALLVFIAIISSIMYMTPELKDGIFLSLISLIIYGALNFIYLMGHDQFYSFIKENKFNEPFKN